MGDDHLLLPHKTIFNEILLVFLEINLKTGNMYNHYEISQSFMFFIFHMVPLEHNHHNSIFEENTGNPMAIEKPPEKSLK